jgi:dimethylamine monooxygenase subunit A
MDFPFEQIAAPFRMQPGLRRLAPGTPQLTPLRAGSALWREKKAVLEAGASRFAIPGFDPSSAIESIAARAMSMRLAGQFGLKSPPGTPLELAFEEDLAVLDGDTGTLPWLCVCVPSHWAPEDKLGLPLAAVHAPVADNALLLAASQHLVQLATGGDCWERFVWTVTPSPNHDQHPKRAAPRRWPATHDPGDFAGQCFLRAERQTFFPVGRGTRQAVFTIRVMLEPLPTAVDSADKARRLHDAIASMTPAVLDYKGLAPARVPLLAWLQRTGAGA